MRPTPLLLLVLVASTALGQPAKARTLNTEGFRLYQAGQFPEALERFQAAAQANPQYALAHYNVAATLGVLRKQRKVCEYQAFPETILQHLTRAVELDPRRLKRAQEDADLEPIRNTVGWHRLLGRSPARAADVPALLQAVDWYGPGVGVYGTLVRLDFQAGGKVVLNRKVPQDEGAPREEAVTGSYRVKRSTVTVTLPGHAKPLTGSLSPTGLLKLQELGAFTDAPSECEA
ncbi:tetratricopeptide repeat protein [Stigmatella hybrida]|uniref:tetratricopeptide repeat protein n=1 Tax=Stigmatella hybrida TaxID=394097 RepID=UPI001CDA6317|nr:tetratricopeptide repeat protein [Stigmatella hybrida]